MPYSRKRSLKGHNGTRGIKRGKRSEEEVEKNRKQVTKKEKERMKAQEEKIFGISLLTESETRELSS